MNSDVASYQQAEEDANPRLLVVIDDSYAPTVDRSKHVVLVLLAVASVVCAFILVQENFYLTELQEVSTSRAERVEIFEDIEIHGQIALNSAGQRFELLSARTPEQKGLLWKEFKDLYGKQYESVEEEKVRFETFLDNMIHIDEWNKKSKGAFYGITKYSDLSHTEFKTRNALRLDPFSAMLKASKNVVDVVEHGFMAKHHDPCPACDGFDDVKNNYNTKSIPDRFDWRDYGAVTSVKNQMFCGNCWAWTAAADMEGTWFIAGHGLVDVSVQEMTSCATASECCDGGMMSFGFEYAIKSGGAMIDSDYPFEDSNGYCTACQENLVSAADRPVKISSWTMIEGTGDDLRAQLMAYGPISIGINATPMQFYQGGVDEHSDCDPAGLDHGVLLVGFGTTSGGDKYWIIKNSWGADWGEQGYYRIADKYGACGIGEISMKSIA